MSFHLLGTGDSDTMADYYKEQDIMADDKEVDEKEKKEELDDEIEGTDDESEDEDKGEETDVDNEDD